MSEYPGGPAGEDEDEGLEGEGEELVEIEISFNPRAEDLEARGVTEEEFEEALLKALEERETFADRPGMSVEDIPPLEDIELAIGGRTFLVRELADIEIVGGID